MEVGSDPAREKPTVVVVEDDPDAQRYMRVLLSSRFKVLLAESGEEMYAHLDAGAAGIGIILMDVSIKGDRDGLTLTRELRCNEQWKELPIVVVTAHVSSEDRRKALDAGGSAYLPKPFQRKQLLSLIDDMLKA
ncbi:MAG: response regulator [Candidatus Binatia bacterium]